MVSLIGGTSVGGLPHRGGVGGVALTRGVVRSGIDIVLRSALCGGMKDANLMIRLSAEHKAEIEAAAERAGLSVSAFVLAAALRAARREK